MLTYISNPDKLQKFRLCLYDILVVLLVFVLSYGFRILFYEGQSLDQIIGRISWLIIPGTIIHVIVFYVFGLYDDFQLKNRKLLFINIFLSVGVATVLVALISYLFPQEKIGRLITSLHFFLMLGVIYIWRILYLHILYRPEKRKLIIAGCDELVEKMIQTIDAGSDVYQLRGLVMAPETQDVCLIQAPPAVPVYDSLQAALTAIDPDTIVFTQQRVALPGDNRRLIDLKFKGKEIFDGTTFYAWLLGRIPVSNISEQWVMFTGQTGSFKPGFYTNIKRLLDISIALGVLICFSPFLLLVAAIIKLDSKGPVFFRQERLGLDEKPFTLYKFRTMVDNAEKDVGPCWASDNDTRFTRSGKFLRKTRLDEFPQFFNVLRGDMSVVGPRPIRQYFADYFTEKFPFYRLRFRVKPGITGWAQVNMHYVNTDEDQYEKLEYEFFYLYHQSLLLDLFVILKTVQSVVKMKGG